MDTSFAESKFNRRRINCELAVCNNITFRKLFRFPNKTSETIERRRVPREFHMYSTCFSSVPICIRLKKSIHRFTREMQSAMVFSLTNVRTPAYSTSGPVRPSFELCNRSQRITHLYIILSLVVVMTTTRCLSCAFPPIPVVGLLSSRRRVRNVCQRRITHAPLYKPSTTASPWIS